MTFAAQSNIKSAILSSVRDVVSFVPVGGIIAVVRDVIPFVPVGGIVAVVRDVVSFVPVGGIVTVGISILGFIRMETGFTWRCCFTLTSFVYNLSYGS